MAGWFRLDSDFGGVQLWAGATYPLSDTIGLATDIYVWGAYGEFDIGPSIVLGEGISILPMVGLGIDWAGQKAVSFVPQFYAYVDTSSIYFEFGKFETHASGPNEVTGVRRGMPAGLVQSTMHGSKGFTEETLRLAGAKQATFEIGTVDPAGRLHAQPLFDAAIRVRWT